MRYALFFIFLILGNYTFSQYDYNGIRYLSDRDAIILNEENVLEFETYKNKRVSSLFISKSQKVSILSEKGVERFSKIELPEVFDQTLIIHAPEARNIHFSFYDIRVIEFEAEILKNDGEKVLPDVKKSVELHKIAKYYTDKFVDYYLPNFEIPDIGVGDQLIIKYKYRVNYVDNLFDLNSFRVFSNTDIFKEKYALKIIYDTLSPIEISYFNNAEPDSIFFIENARILLWDRNNVKGNIAELNARPFLELPHIQIDIIPISFLYLWFKNRSETYLPDYTFYAKMRETGFYSIVDEATHGVNSAQNLKINRFLTNIQTDRLEDSLMSQKLLTTHNYIAENLNFFPNVEYFEEKGKYDIKPGDCLENNYISDITRNGLYVYFISKMDLPFYTSYLIDNRSGSFENRTLGIMAVNDYLFAIPCQNKSIHYLLPKTSRYGYFADELPFYYEGSTSILVHLMDYIKRNAGTKFSISAGASSYFFEKFMSDFNPGKSDIPYEHYKSFIRSNPVETRVVKLPDSKITDNARKTNTLVNVNLGNNTINFNSRINLSGQYSTMTRGVYQYNVRDNTVNPLYNEKIWENIAGVSDTSAQVEVINMEFPFNTNVNAAFSSSEIMEQQKDTISICLVNWFKHIIYPNMDIENRTLNFYPDFQGRDTYVYFLKFDQDVKLVESIDKLSLQNDFGELEIEMSQQDPRSIKISSSFAVVAEKVKKENINMVGEIYNSIENLNQFSLKVQKAK